MALPLGGGEDEGRMEGEEIETRGGKWRGVITMGFILPKVNFLVTSLVMFSFIEDEIEAVGAYIK